MKDLWILLLSAQKSPNGIVIHLVKFYQPEEFIKEKKIELKLKTEQQKEKLDALKKMMGNSAVENKKETANNENIVDKNINVKKEIQEIKNKERRESVKEESKKESRSNQGMFILLS